MPLNLYGLIDLMKTRTAMYVGESTITAVNAFIKGYFAACVANEIDEKLTPDFGGFNDFTAAYFKWRESTAGWKNILLEECGHDESTALSLFFNLFDAFRGK